MEELNCKIQTLTEETTVLNDVSCQLERVRVLIEQDPSDSTALDDYITAVN